MVRVLPQIGIFVVLAGHDDVTVLVNDLCLDIVGLVIPVVLDDRQLRIAAGQPDEYQEWHQHSRKPYPAVGV